MREIAGRILREIADDTADLDRGRVGYEIAKANYVTGMRPNAQWLVRVQSVYGTKSPASQRQFATTLLIGEVDNEPGI